MKVIKNGLARPVYRTEVLVYIDSEFISMFVYSCCVKYNYAVNSVQPNDSELNQNMWSIKMCV